MKSTISRHIAILTAAVALPLPALQAADIFLDNFEGAQQYTPNFADTFADVANKDFYGTTNQAFLDANSTDFQYGNIQGTNFYTHNDGDAALPPHSGTLTLTYSNIDISNWIDLEFGIFVANDDASDGSNDFDSSDQFFVNVQIDGGGFNNILSLQSENVGGDTTNELLREDTNGDTHGDGTIVTSSFSEFVKDIAGAGSSLDIELRYTSTSWSADEDIALDNVRLSGTFIPEPTGFALVGLGGLLLAFRRRH